VLNESSIIELNFFADFLCKSSLS